MQPEMHEPKIRSWVAAHFAVTADGKISTAAGTSAQFTSPADKVGLLRVRAEHDAVMVARGTLEKDRMVLGVREEALRAGRVRRGQSEEPLRVIISGSGSFSPELPIFRYPGGPIVLYTTVRMPIQERAALAGKLTIQVMGEQEVDLPKVLHHLRTAYQVRKLVCEGGPALVKSLAEHDLIDEIFLTIAAKLFGGSLALTMTGLPGKFLPASRRFRLTDVEKGENEIYLTYRKEACI
jgi:riboflavin-specific deaminase-like protein